MYISQSAISRQIQSLEKELYCHLRLGTVDLVLTDQRRAFSDEYVNYELLRCGCYAEISVRNRLGAKDEVTIEELQATSCILISSREQQNVEQEYYQNTLGCGGEFLFAESMEEGRLMTVGNRGFLPVESVGTLPATSPTIRRLPIMRGGVQLRRNYCVFWQKERSNYYYRRVYGYTP